MSLSINKLYTQIYYSIFDVARNVNKNKKMFKQKSWNLLNLMKNISLSSQNRQIFAACYLRHDLFVERKNKYIKKHSKDLKSQKERLQNIAKYVGTQAHKIHRHDIQDLTFICENEEDVSILRQIILGTRDWSIKNRTGSKFDR